MAMGETILLYEVSEEKATQLKILLYPDKIRIKVIDIDDYNQTLGAMVGMKGFVEDQPCYMGDHFTEEMMVINLSSDKRLDMVLKKMQRAKISISLKAILTRNNVSWSSAELYEEIIKEREAVKEQIQSQSGDVKDL